MAASGHATAWSQERIAHEKAARRLPMTIDGGMLPTRDVAEDGMTIDGSGRPRVIRRLRAAVLGRPRRRGTSGSQKNQMRPRRQYLRTRQRTIETRPKQTMTVSKEDSSKTVSSDGRAHVQEDELSCDGAVGTTTRSVQAGPSEEVLALDSVGWTMSAVLAECCWA